MTDHELVPESTRAVAPARGNLPGTTYDARPAQDLDDFDVRGALRQVINSVRAHRVLILLFTLASGALMQAYFKLYPPVYEGKVMVLSESDKDVVREEYYKLWSTFRKNDLDSDVELATSFPVVRRVVEKLNLKYDDVYHPPYEHTLYLWEQSWIGKKYRSIKEWFFPKEPEPYALSPEMKELARTVREFKSGASLTPVPGSHVGTVLVRGPTPRVAEYANTLIDVFIDERRSEFASEAKQAYDALATEVDKAKQEFIQAQAAIQAFETRNGLLMGFQKEEAVMAQWVDLGQVMAKLEAQLASQRKALEVVTAELKQEPEDLDLSTTDQASEVKNRMRTQLFELENKLTMVRTRMQEDSPEVRELKAQMEQVRSSLNAEPDKRQHASTRAKNENHLLLRQSQQNLMKSIAGSTAELEARRETYKKMGDQLAQLPRLKAESAVLQQDLNNTGTRHKLLRERLMMAEVSYATAKSAPSTMKVISYALPPSKAEWPKKKLFMLVALLIGGMAGVAVGLLLDMITNFATRERLAVRQDLPVFGTIELDVAGRDAPALGYGRDGGGRRRAIDRLKGS